LTLKSFLKTKMSENTIEKNYRSDDEYERILQEEREGKPWYFIGESRVSEYLFAFNKLVQAMIRIDEAEQEKAKLPKEPYTPIIHDPKDDLWVP
jgi:hypothetical protein